MDELMLRIENVSKQYRLGQIGGTTLRDELQRMRAKWRGEEDPTKIVGTKSYNKRETFMALDGVSFDVKKGERVGIIGHNGAGKSTLLKLISRVTAPTGGTIGLNGRVASMLEVGTGFHGELTGRENIYMNGAILGMTKKEIDTKIEDIIDFSEVRRFIDTPVKRYSSGMYVKLAFSVAAHLDSEIMIMDEVLAVGDMAFQKKCLEKMSDVSKNQGRTILYVSHNMNTIRQLCDRVIVLDHGKVVFDGDVEEGIARYLQTYAEDHCVERSLVNAPRVYLGPQQNFAKFTYMSLLNKENNQFDRGERINIKLKWVSEKQVDSISIRFIFRNAWNTAVASSVCLDFAEMNIGENNHIFSVPTDGLVNGRYFITILLLERNSFGTSVELDIVKPAFTIVIESNTSFVWVPDKWGSIRLQDSDLIDEICE